MDQSNHASVLAQAHRLVFDNQYRSAVSLLSDYLNAHPDDLLAHGERAKIYMTLDRDADMQADLNTVLACSPQTAVEYNAYGLALAVKGFTGPMAEAKNTWARAEVAFEQSIRLDPRRVDVYRHRAQLCIWQDNLQSELADLDRALLLAPDDIELLWSRAFARHQLDKGGSGALADMNEMIRLEPENAEHYKKRHFLRQEADQIGQLEDLNRALQLQPRDVESLNNRALLYKIMQNDWMALQDYERVLQIDPNNQDALMFSGWDYQSAGKHDIAIDRFSRLIQREPDKSAWYEHRAKSYRALGQVNAAETDERRAAELKRIENAAAAQAMASEARKNAPSEPGLIQFAGHYWQSLIWAGLAVFTLVVMGLVLVTSPSGSLNSPFLSLLLIGFCAAAYRAFRNGFRMQRHADGVMMTITATLLSLAFATVIWPFFELFRQIRFLIQAWTAWQRGEILVDERGRKVRTS